ncbi:LLM class flavin-dependent oxidoreductase [Kibdelosporangium aridum]|uniref:LLM class flavin-dependent oxidoreductase n=1 Tax=Kibdelosporangium aridum TaxID=2030 RepID=A0A428YZV8_KIBAR|nr:LLM class flavin-dependent oxidoreductase [Kibdelosporangium aridum]RSM76987.1 LLM class flavin-dependent oxidoreductase [Kibdelosporangium aridum]
MAIPYSVLDLATVGEGQTSAEALRASIDLARRTEELGFHRFWVAEHHNMPGVASSAPSVLIAHLASATSRIRVGSGGVMLPNHAPLVVAEQFGMLEAFHPGRIDLGLGRAPGTDPRTAHALRRSPGPLSADDFPEQLSELISYFAGDPTGITAVPAAGNKPPIWLLGSSGYSAQLSGMLGMPFAFAHHFSAQNTLPALALYRKHFQPSARLEKPYAMVAASVICAETDEQAQYLAGPGALSWVRLRSGHPGVMATPEEAAAYPYTDMERLIVEDRLSNQIIGSPATVERGIEKLLAETEADELMITTMVHSPSDRVRSYELVAGLR